LFSGLSQAQQYSVVNEIAPMVPREFRAAWVACVYNIDWPSRKGMGAGAQQAEMKAMLDPNGIDENERDYFSGKALMLMPVYQSRLEPWSHWISGTQGISPGYDPLAYCIQQAHARGIEVHAWFNPFRALPNSKIPTARNHVVKTHPSVIPRFQKLQMDGSL
jgi:uncharacterized lipoprotein YddW (UPF0748 family)